MGVLRSLEYVLARLLLNSKGKDAKLLTRSPLFGGIPKNVTVTSPTLGASPANLSTEHSQFGTSKFPELSWSLNLDGLGIEASDVKEWFLIVEDPDAPIPIVPNHGMYYALPATKTSVDDDDFAPCQTKGASKSDTPEIKYLAGGFRAGKNLRGTVYSGPRPPTGHGEHRYFFQVVALKETLDLGKMKPVATRDEVLREMESKVCGWGEWVGIYENKW